jgi:hypothetical protein
LVRAGGIFEQHRKRRAFLNVNSMELTVLHHSAFRRHAT